MAISSQPTVLAQSNDAYINVGVTGRLQTFSAATGTLTINPTSGSFIRITNLVGAVTVNWTGVPAGYGTRWQPVMRPLRSSRTRSSPPQFSSAHGR